MQLFTHRGKQKSKHMIKKLQSLPYRCECQLAVFVCHYRPSGKSAFWCILKSSKHHETPDRARSPDCRCSCQKIQKNDLICQEELSQKSIESLSNTNDQNWWTGWTRSTWKQWCLLDNLKWKQTTFFALTSLYKVNTDCTMTISAFTLVPYKPLFDQSVTRRDFSGKSDGSVIN